MDYRHGVSLFLVDYTWIPDRNGLQTNWIYAMDIRRYRFDVIPNVSHKLFDSVCAFLTAVSLLLPSHVNCLTLFDRSSPPFNCYHLTVITVTRLTGLTLLVIVCTVYFVRFHSLSSLVDRDVIWTSALDTDPRSNVLRFPTFPFKKVGGEPEFSFIIIVNSSRLLIFL